MRVSGGSESERELYIYRRIIRERESMGSTERGEAGETRKRKKNKMKGGCEVIEE